MDTCPICLETLTPFDAADLCGKCAEAILEPQTVEAILGEDDLMEEEERLSRQLGRLMEEEERLSRQLGR